MKLTIGEKWHRDETEYVEELTVEGLESIDSQLPNGEVVLPKDGESIIQVRIINNIREKFHTTELPLKQLVDRWERGEADL